MKTKNNLIQSCLLGAVLFALTATASAQFTFTTNNGAITITGYTGSAGTVTIPSTTNGYQVISIGDYAFQYNTSVTNVVIPNGVTNIGQFVFLGCTSLNTVMIPNTVISIGQEAFLFCYDLTTVNLPSSVTSIGAAAFAECIGLTAINVSPGNSAYSSSFGILFNQNQTVLVEYPQGKPGTSYIVPNSVTSIGDQAFESCGLTSVTLGSSVADIGEQAFTSCNLTSVFIPPSVSSISEDAFSDCSSLTGVYFQGNAPNADSTVFSSDDNLIAVYYYAGTTGWSPTFANVSAVEVPVNSTVTISASPGAGGTISGGGTFTSGSSQTVTATANSGYTFANWTENGFVVSPATNYALTLNGNVNLVANFTAKPVSYSVTVSASPGAAGTVAGGGTFVSGTLQTLMATANTGYTFANWTENGSVVNSSASYTFTLGSNLNLVANYIASPFVMYVPSSFGSISKVTSAGVASTLVSYFGSPAALAVDQNGNLYAAAGNVYKFTPAGVMSTYASGFSEPTGVAFDEIGNLYVADFGNGTISKVTPAGVVSPFASGFTVDPHLGGNGTLSVACDGNGNVFLADYDAGTVTKITPTGAKSVYANGISYILSIATDVGGNVYLADFYGTITKITPTGMVSTFANVSGYVTGLAFDDGGNLYASSTIAGGISRITTAGVISTFMAGFSGPIAIFSGPAPPTITMQPQNQGFIEGQFAEFNVAAAGQNIGYQWNASTDGGATWTPLANGSTYDGVALPTLTVADATPAFSGSEYKCLVTNALGSTTSSSALLTNVSFLMYAADEMNDTVCTITPTGTVTLLTSGLNHPLAFAFDQSGNVYIANQGDNTVSKITPEGVASTFASGFYQPDALAFDGSGNLYVANALTDPSTISKVTPAGVVSTFASGFAYPSALAFDGGGNLYVANPGNNTVSKVTPAGVVSTFANGFAYPSALAFGGAGNLYVANWESNTVSQVTPAGLVSTFASGFNEPISLAFDNSGNLYVANYANSSVGGSVSKVTPTGKTIQFSAAWSDLAAIAILAPPVPPLITIQPQNETVVAGQNAVFSIDVSGAPSSNVFQWLVSADGGNTWAPFSNNSPYTGATSATLMVTNPISGYEYECVVANALGSATSSPAMLTCLPFLIYTTESFGGNGAVYQITPAGAAGNFAGGFYSPNALAVDRSGNLYVADGIIYKVTPAGVASTFASGFSSPTALAFALNGNLYEADEGNGTVSKITSTGAVTTFASGFSDPTALVCDTNGNVYVADYSDSTVSKITPAGTVSVFASEVFNPQGMAIDRSGNIYVTDVLGYVYKVTPGGAVSTFASGLAHPAGLAFDGNGNLYVACENGGTVSKITPGGSVSTLAGGLSEPYGLALVTAPAPPTTGNYTIAVAVAPGAGGTAFGGGTFAPGSSSLQTVTATANSGYVFANWTVNGHVVSLATSYYFTLAGNVNLVANFNKVTYQTLDNPLAASTPNAGTVLTGISGNNIVGHYTDLNGYTPSFLYNSGTYIILSDPDSSGTTTANGISGDSIVGTYSTGNVFGFFYGDGTYTTLEDYDSISGNTWVNGIDGTNIVGYFSDDNGIHGFLYSGSTYVTLDDPNSYPIYELGYLSVGTTTSASGISGGNIVGSYSDSAGIGTHGFLYTDGSYTTLDDPNGVGSTSASGINGTNIIGSYTGLDGNSHGFIYNGSAYNNLDDPNGVTTYPQGISGNTVVGYYTDSNNVSHGFMATVTVVTNYTLIVNASPNAGGTAHGAGTFVGGSSQVVTATANSGFIFTNWTVNGSVVSFLSSYTFTVANNLTLQANFVDLDKPTASITNVPVGLNVSNAAFTVRGTAGDNWQVAGVYYSLNSGRWNLANSGNSWSNWTAQLTLTPGTNTISVYANDPSGDASTITNASLFFAATNQLQIRSTGLGTISPNYSNAWLDIGRNYSITGAPASGFVFTNWTVSTNWAGGTIVAGTNLQFMMASNLTLLATFVETSQPSSTITAPATGQHMTNVLVALQGTTSDKWGVAGVSYQLNGGTWNASSTTNGWTNWASTLELVAGTNMLKAYAINLGGNFSATGSVSVVSSNTFKLQLVFTNAVPLKTNGLVFSLQLSTGLNGHIQVSTNLTSWTTLTNFVGTNFMLTFRDPAATNSPKRFYRAVIP